MCDPYDERIAEECMNTAFDEMADHLAEMTEAARDAVDALDLLDADGRQWAQFARHVRQTLGSAADFSPVAPSERGIVATMERLAKARFARAKLARLLPALDDSGE